LPREEGGNSCGKIGKAVGIVARFDEILREL
jgi:hypothetical protein